MVDLVVVTDRNGVFSVIFCARTDSNRVFTGDIRESTERQTIHIGDNTRPAKGDARI